MEDGGGEMKESGREMSGRGEGMERLRGCEGEGGGGGGGGDGEIG